jgi:RNA polymerase sigma factor (sigma-70 family)
VATAFDKHPFDWDGDFRAEVHAFSLRITRNPHDAEDLTHQTYVRIAQSKSIDGTVIEESLAYAKTVALHLWLDTRKRRQKSPVSFVSEDSIPERHDAGENPVEEAIVTEEVARLQKALDSLPARQREVYRLRRLDIPLLEIAARLTISRSTATRDFSNALQTLKNVLGDEGSVSP